MTLLSAHWHSLNSAWRQHQCHPQNCAGVPVGLIPGTGWGKGQSTFHSLGASACTAGHQVKSALVSAQGDVLPSPSSLGTWCFIFVGERCTGVSCCSGSTHSQLSTWTWGSHQWGWGCLLGRESMSAFWEYSAMLGLHKRALRWGNYKKIRASYREMERKGVHHYKVIVRSTQICWTGEHGNHRRGSTSHHVVIFRFCLVPGMDWPEPKPAKSQTGTCSSITRALRKIKARLAKGKKRRKEKFYLSLHPLIKSPSPALLQGLSRHWKLL